MRLPTTHIVCNPTQTKRDPANAAEVLAPTHNDPASEGHTIFAASGDVLKGEVMLNISPAPQESRYASADGAWYALEEAVVGLAHRNKNLPCQDAAQAVCGVRTVLVVADGAGSSAVSEIGAQAVVTGTVRLLDTLDKSLAELLDLQVNPEQTAARSMGLLLVKHAMGLLKDLAVQHRREVRDFRSTLLVVVVGQRRLLWVKVGDGALVVERMRLGRLSIAIPVWESVCATLGDAGKGEFANMTQFLDAIAPQDVQIGMIDSADISGVAVMSDGAAEKLVSNDGQIVASRVSVLLDKLRQDRLRRTELTKMFYDEEFCQGTTGDDRSIALAARMVSPAPELPGERLASTAGSELPKSEVCRGALALEPPSTRKKRGHRRR